MPNTIREGLSVEAEFLPIVTKYFASSWSRDGRFNAEPRVP